jgi:hypothetical protein
VVLVAYRVEGVEVIMEPGVCAEIRRVGAAVREGLEEVPPDIRYVFDEDLSRRMASLREMAAAGHKVRNSLKIKARQPVAQLLIILKESDARDIPFYLRNSYLLRDELNVKVVKFVVSAVSGNEYIFSEGGA